MIIFPAIDLRGGKCVRLYKGDFHQETIFSEDPAGTALKWEKMGAKYLHVVDLDGALNGHSMNITTLKLILGAVHIPVELGGGIRSLANIDAVLSLGVRRVILGSVAVKDPELVKTACAEFGDRIVVGIDAKDGVVAVNGWGDTSNMNAPELAVKMSAAGVRTLIYTDISRDGTLSGVNIDGAVHLAKVSGAKVIVSGGVSSIDDIKAVKAHEQDGLEGVIVGKSIYTDKLDLREALQVAAEGE